MQGGWPPRLKSGLVDRTRIPFVALKVEGRIVLGFAPHDAISGDLGEHRRSRNRHGGRVAPDDRAGFSTPDKVPIAVNEDSVGLDPEPVDGSPSRQSLRGRHSQFIAFGVAGMPDRPGDAPTGYPVEQRLSFLLSQHLRVTDLVDAGVVRYHCRPDAERPRPGTAPHFVDADHDSVSETPHAALNGQVGSLYLERLAEAGHGG